MSNNPSSSSATTMTPPLPPPPSREVASGVVNLGNTCYMNAVLQALAHAPELCLAIDIESHLSTCPVARSNEERRLLRLKQKKDKEEKAAQAKGQEETNKEGSTTTGNGKSGPSTTLSSNADGKTSTQTAVTNVGNSNAAAGKKGKSKSKRTNGKSPPRSNNGTGTTNDQTNNKDKEGDDDDDSSYEFCVLCELEKHVHRVHTPSSSLKLGTTANPSSSPLYNSSSISTTTTASASSSSNAAGEAVAPTTFVNGFITHVAPWFKLGVQEDSHEFLRLLIDAMQKSCERARNKNEEDTNQQNDGDGATSGGDDAATTTAAASDEKKQEERMGTNGGKDKDVVMSVAPEEKEEEKQEKNDVIKNIPDENMNDQPDSKDDDKQQHTTNDNNNTKSNNSNNNRNNDDETDVEYPFRLFRGTVESNVHCSSCHTSSLTLDPIEDIGLEVTPATTTTTAVTTSNSNNNNTGIGGNSTSSNSPTPGAVSSSSAVLSSSSTSSSSSLSTWADVTLALERFTNTEKLDSGYKCDRCGQLGQATKQSRLASIPPILTLHLKRFRYGSAADLSNLGCGVGSGGGMTTTLMMGLGSTGMVTSSRRSGGRYSSMANTDFNTVPGSSALASSTSTTTTGTASNDYNIGGAGAGGGGGGMIGFGGTSGSAKIEGHIRFSEILNIHPYLTPALQQKCRSMFCRLFAVIVHAGKHSHSGHYVAYVRNVTKNEWWKMDDARVTRVSAQEVVSAEAYMLFYRVVDHPISAELRKAVRVRREEAAKAAAAAAAAAAAKELEEQKEKEKREAAEAESMAQAIENNNTGDVASTKDVSGEGEGMDTTGSTATTVAASGKKRKREAPQYKTGEEWAKAKTNLAPSFMSVLQRAEEYINENVEFTQDYFRFIMEEAAKGGKVGCGPSGVCADDIQGGPEKFRRGILEILYQLVKAHEGGEQDFFKLDPQAKGCDNNNDDDVDDDNGGDNGKMGVGAENSPSSLLLGLDPSSLIVPVLDANDTIL